MATYQIEVNGEIEKLLKNLVQQTHLTVDELVVQGLLKLQNNNECIDQKNNFFDIYSQLDIGEDDNCRYSSAEAKQQVNFWEALQQFRQENDLSDFEGDIFSQVRDKSTGREITF